MASHLAENPVVDLTEGLYWLDILDEMIASGAIQPNPWFINTRKFLEEMLEACQTPPGEEDSHDEEGAEKVGNVKESVGEDTTEQEVEASLHPSELLCALMCSDRLTLFRLCRNYC